MTIPTTAEVLRWIDSDPVARELVKRGPNPLVIKTLARRLESQTKPQATAINPTPRKREVKPMPEPPGAEIEYIGPTTEGKPMMTFEDLMAFRHAVAVQEAAMNPETTAVGVHGFTPCQVCGGGCSPRARLFGPWRQHRECASLSTNGTRALAACEALGIPLDPAAAELVELRVPPFAETHREPTWARGDAKGAWRHVSRRALQKAAREAQKTLTRALAQKACTSGQCAWCGVVRAQSWHVSPYLRADGSEAPLCATCEGDFTTTGSPESGEALRAGLSFATTGVPHPMGESVPALRAHFEVGGGDGTAWSHLPAEALEAFRLEQWAKYGGKFASADRRAEALALAEEKERQKVAKTAEVRAEAEKRADVHGFL